MTSALVLLSRSQCQNNSRVGELKSHVPSHISKLAVAAGISSSYKCLIGFAKDVVAVICDQVQGHGPPLGQGEAAHSTADSSCTTDE